MWADHQWMLKLLDEMNMYIVSEYQNVMYLIIIEAQKYLFNEIWQTPPLPSD